MKYRTLGSTGLFVSCLSFGASNFGGAHLPVYNQMGSLSVQEAERIIGTLLDAGVNLIDTADVYAQGEAESVLGKALGGRRKETLLSTKVTNRMGPGPNDVGQSRVHLMSAVEASLRRLGTDYIDLYTIHKFDPFTRFDECLRTLDDMVRQGKVRHIGCSNLAAWQIMKALGVSALHHLEPFAFIQAFYSLVGRDIEREIAPFAVDQNLAIISWGTLAGGFLTGKFTRTSVPSGTARRLHFEFPPIDLERAYDVVDVAAAVAERHGATVAQIALAWQFTKPFMTSVLFGARNLDQVADNLKAVEINLSEQDLKELDDVSRLTKEYPQWMIELPLGREPGSTRDWSKAAKT